MKIKGVFLLLIAFLLLALCTQSVYSHFIGVKLYLIKNHQKSESCFKRPTSSDPSNFRANGLAQQKKRTYGITDDPFFVLDIGNKYNFVWHIICYSDQENRKCYKFSLLDNREFISELYIAQQFMGGETVTLQETKFKEYRSFLTDIKRVKRYGGPNLYETPEDISVSIIRLPKIPRNKGTVVDFRSANAYYRIPMSEILKHNKKLSAFIESLIHDVNKQKKHEPFVHSLLTFL